MKPAPNPTYRTAAFAALAGVTSRALRHYDRLGLLKPKRSSAGYRIYSERDLEALEEIVALKFIGVPLKEIATLRRRAGRPFLQVLRAQRTTLEAKRRALTRAIAAVAAAEASVQSGAAIDTTLFRRLIEVMNMDTQHDDAIARYSAMLKAKASHLAAMSTAQRTALQQEWSTLVADVKAALGEDPGSPKAQQLLDRWQSFLHTLTGTEPAVLTAPGAGSRAVRVTPALHEMLWARRVEWLPDDAVRETSDLTNAEEALARVRERVSAFAGREVLDFIMRARNARGRGHAAIRT
jgi:MerR family transcriptional regulator, thiopeptide resistance regulator